MSGPESLRLGVVLFEQFELLDVFGPLEMFGLCDGRFEVVLIGPAEGAVVSAQGPRVFADSSYDKAPPCDIALVPGGRGAREMVENPRFLKWLADWAAQAEYVASVCTGSGILAASGLLDGRRATSNKRAFAWATLQGKNVTWIAEARWVQDGSCWTSSGVSAGMDMTLALIAHLHGVELALEVADRAEYEWHSDPSWDPFAVKNGLVNDRSDPPEVP